jgi:hypothetical protein
MANRDLELALRVFADTHRLDSGLRRGEGSVRRFASTTNSALRLLDISVRTLAYGLAGVGAGLLIKNQLRDTALMDKSLGQLGQTAGVVKSKTDELRASLWQTSKDTGVGIDQLQEGHAALIASGQSWKAAVEEINAVGTATAVTGANSKVLAAGLTVAGEAFQFDLEKPGKALELLDQMTVAGRQGNAELENLADIFAHVGINSSSAGMGFEKTLGFIEALSLIERQPERLATLADSTLRLFVNRKYAEKATEATGIKFFDKKGGRRDPVEVLKEFKRQYDKLKTDEQRSKYVQKVLDGADLDTIKGFKTLLSGDFLDKIGKFSKDIKDAAGTLKHDFADAINNAADQTNRLKASLGEAGDAFAEPIDKIITRVEKFFLDQKKPEWERMKSTVIGWENKLGERVNKGLDWTEGKLNSRTVTDMSGGELIGTAVGIAAGGAVLKVLGPKLLGAVGGVAAGKAIEDATGVTPVFVTNWPAGGVGGALGDAAAGAAAAAGLPKIFSKVRTAAALLGGMSLSDLPMLGASAVGMGAAGVALAGAAGYGAGTLAYDYLIPDSAADRIGYGIAKAMSLFDDDASRAVVINENQALKDKIARDYGGAGRERGVVDQQRLAQQIEQAISGGDLAEQIRSAIKEVGNKKATVTLRLEGAPARVQGMQTQGIDLNVDTGILPVGR